ncbi:MAG TPA: hypothetical protein VGG64_25890 [Pirellulales bacterium]|jgi:hypothetical protein
MRLLTWPVLAAALALIPAERTEAQSGIRVVRATGTSRTSDAAQRDNGPSLRLTSQVTSEEIVTEEGQVSGEYADAGYAPGEAATGVSCGAAFGGPGASGYFPDFGYTAAGGRMSVWPGVPACCDPWFGYCGEPRCFNACGCHQGTYQYFHCASGACSPELIKWNKGGACCKPSAMCYGAKGCSTAATCAKCRSASFTPGSSGAGTGCCTQDTANTSGAVVKPTPVDKPKAPRNDLPTTSAGPSARRANAPRT